MRRLSQGGLLRSVQLTLAGFKLAIDDALAALELLPCLLQRLVGVDVFVRQHQLLSTVLLVLSSLECLRRLSKGRLLRAVKRRLAALEFLPRLLQSLLRRDVLVSEHQLLSTILLVLRGLEGLGLGRQVGLLGAIKLSLALLKSPVGGVLAPGEVLLLRLQVSLLRPISSVFATLELLARLLQRLLSRDVLVGEHDLLRTVLLVLSSLEGLGFRCKICLLRAVKFPLPRLKRAARRVLGPGELLLLRLQRGLLSPIKFGLRGSEVLPCRLQRLVGFDALVGQRHLLRTIQFSFGLLELLLRPQHRHLLAAVQLGLRGLEGLLRLR